VDTSDSNKRDAERVDLLGLLSGEVMVYQGIGIREMSRTGMQIESSFPLQLGSLHDFRLTLAERSVVIKGRVVHSRISDVDQDIVTYRSGIEFTEAPERVVVVITEFLARLQQNRKP
jgi:hypothetical protein